MKSDLFLSAISKRKKVQFLYGIMEIIIDPYYITRNSVGKKIVYGKLNYSSEIRAFEYDKITNLKIIEYSQFSPIIPILPMAN
jgi:hypothetical protein